MPKQKIPNDAASFGYIEYFPSEYALALENTLTERQRSHIKFGSEKKGGCTISSLKEGLVRAGIPVRDFLILNGLKIETNKEIEDLVSMIDQIQPVETKIKLLSYIRQMQPDWEGMPAPIIAKDKFTRLYYRLQTSKEERAKLEEAGLKGITPGHRTKNELSQMTKISNLFGVSVHWILGLGYDDLLFGKAPFTDLIIDYYLLLPRHIKPVIYSIFKALGGPK